MSLRLACTKSIDDDSNVRCIDTVEIYLSEDFIRKDSARTGFSLICGLLGISKLCSKNYSCVGFVKPREGTSIVMESADFCPAGIQAAFFISCNLLKLQSKRELAKCYFSLVLLIFAIKSWRLLESVNKVAGKHLSNMSFSVVLNVVAESSDCLAAYSSTARTFVVICLLFSLVLWRMLALKSLSQSEITQSSWYDMMFCKNDIGKY